MLGSRGSGTKAFRRHCDKRGMFNSGHNKRAAPQIQLSVLSSLVPLSAISGIELTPFFLRPTLFVQCLSLCTISFFSSSLCALSQPGRFREAASQAKVVT